MSQHEPDWKRVFARTDGTTRVLTDSAVVHGTRVYREQHVKHQPARDPETPATTTILQELFWTTDPAQPQPTLSTALKPATPEPSTP